MAATAESVSFDILLGGKVTPEVLKALKDMEERLKQFGATTRTVKRRDGKNAARAGFSSGDKAARVSGQPILGGEWPPSV